MLQYEDYCQRCSRPDWNVIHQIEDNHTNLDDHLVPDQQVKAARRKYGVGGRKLWAIMAQLPCYEVNAA